MIWILGDNHGHFDHVLEAVKATGERPSAVIFLGDLDCPKPFSQCVADIEAVGIQCWAIPGNHDTDSAENYRNLFEDSLFKSRNLHSRIVEIDGLRVAGLGGVFRGEIWFPRETGLEEPVYQSYAAYLETSISQRPARLRGHGLFEKDRKHMSSIFYEDWLHLYGQSADVLVTHEAPDCHPHGFKPITALAQSMKVRFAFHGHHHDSLDYRRHDDRLGFQAFGVGFCGITDVFGGRIAVGDFDEARRYRQATVSS